jgi:putative hydrolase of the HAD superfamily
MKRTVRNPIKPATYSSVVFDFGGVLISPITASIGELAARHGVSMEQLLYVLMGPREVSTADHPWHRGERGEIPIDDLQQMVAPWADEVGISLTGDEIAVMLSGVFTVNHAVVERLAGLRADGYVTALLTNSFREFRPVLERSIDLSLFDVVIDSSEVGLRKPEPEIYELTTDRVGVEAGRIVYLDDFLANVEGAQAFGWTAIHVTSPEQALADLDLLLASA